jgi:hypothetical protein
MAAAAAAWASYTAAVGWFATGRLPVLGASWNEFFNTLLGEPRVYIRCAAACVRRRRRLSRNASRRHAHAPPRHAAASFVRANVPHRTHWARAFAVTLMIAMGA